MEHPTVVTMIGSTVMVAAVFALLFITTVIEMACDGVSSGESMTIPCAWFCLGPVVPLNGNLNATASNDMDNSVFPTLLLVPSCLIMPPCTK